MNGNKVNVVKSDMHPDKYRVVVNVSDEYSVGIVLTKGELKTLFSDIRDVLEQE